ncbi:hypothetical protein JHW43_006264 [Diplocarpon mali]|nr:hypothetical protein JHW43_006264 [Diplocarpon mali]
MTCPPGIGHDFLISSGRDVSTAPATGHHTPRNPSPLPSARARARARARGHAPGPPRAPQNPWPEAQMPPPLVGLGFAIFRTHDASTDQAQPAAPASPARQNLPPRRYVTEVTGPGPGLEPNQSRARAEPEQSQSRARARTRAEPEPEPERLVTEGLPGGNGQMAPHPEWAAGGDHSVRPFHPVSSPSLHMASAIWTAAEPALVVRGACSATVLGHRIRLVVPSGEDMSRSSSSPSVLLCLGPLIPAWKQCADPSPAGSRADRSPADREKERQRRTEPGKNLPPPPRAGAEAEAEANPEPRRENPASQRTIRLASGSTCQT